MSKGEPVHVYPPEDDAGYRFWCLSLVGIRPSISVPRDDILPASLFDSLGDRDADADDPQKTLPRPSECAVHLQLLEAFSAMKAQCLESSSLTRALHLRTNGQRKQAKWNTFVALAIIRFHKWWNTLSEILDETNKVRSRPEMVLKMLPPLDVLMIWMTKLFLPSAYRSECEDSIPSHNVYAMEFPWDLLHRVLDPLDSTYRLPDEAGDYFRQKTSHEPDLFAHLTCRRAHDRLSSQFLKQLSRSWDEAAKPLDVNELGAQPTDFSELIRDYATWNYDIKRLRPLVQSQESFWESMGKAGWLRSPHAAFTLGRAISRYHELLLLRMNNPNSGDLSPTDAIDLAWRTHQCSPARYSEGIIGIVGRFINYDIGNARFARATGGFQKAKALYDKTFQPPYDQCMCWSCEAKLANQDADSADSMMVRKADAEVLRALQVEKARRAGRLTVSPA